MLKITALLAFVVIIASKKQFCSAQRRILNGLEAETRQFPYMVAMNRKHSTKHLASGVLVSVNFVLTAMSPIIHFKSNASNLEMKMGTANTKEVAIQGWSVDAVRIIAYPGYEHGKIAINLALVEMERGVPRCRYFFGVIAPIFVDERKVSKDRDGLIIGWGPTTSNGISSSVLRYQHVKVLHNNEEIMKDTINIWNTTNGLCATDIGGPLVSTTGLIGIAVSASCDDGQPDRFARISDHANWIFSIIILT